MRSPSKKAFTLIEMLVTVVLLSMILSMCYAILFATLESKEKVEGLVESGKIAQGVLQVMIRDLEGCYLYEQSQPLVGEKKLGDPKLTFLSWISDSTSVGIKNVQYVLKKRSDGQQDQYTLFRGLALAGAKEFTYQEIYDQINKLKVEYWKGADWVDEWKEKTPPKAVKITLEIPEKHKDKSSKITSKTYTTIVSLPGVE